MEKNWVMREVETGDQSALAELRGIIEGETRPDPSRPPEFYHWKYFENPLQPSYAHLAEIDGRVVGVVGAVTKRVKFRDRLILCAELTDISTHPDYRQRGVFTTLTLKVCQELERDGVELIYVSPNEISYPILVQNLGFKALFKLRTIYYPLKPENIIRAQLKDRVPFPIVRLMARIGARIRYHQKKDSPIPQNEIDIVETPAFPDEVSELWQTVARNHDLIVVRDKNYLDWRHALFNHVVYTARKGEHLVGYIVVIDLEKKPNGIKHGRIVDLLADPTESGVTEALLKRALAHFETRRVDLVSTRLIYGEWARGDALHHILNKMGFRVGTDFNFVVRTNLFQGSSSYRWLFRVGDIDAMNWR